MRYPLGALFLASCSMLAPLPAEHQAEHQMAEEPATAIHPELGNGTETRKPKPRISSSPSPSSEIASCATLDAGDMKETIKAKLDCITENARRDPPQSARVP
ncbi:hypothetical protein SAMN05216315_103126 [Nitrosospira sp. Nsp18]|uniref:hypothetical protein n=1 Tax=Nitrosospira sp. Nsp18 TaxID=1855334 RepID=UPI0008833AEC|nr:hypothetical protein [Nitrosospira sp. Nsp18]SDA12576.1 hypothetical protein SAMN05216315_103126 [Nitrosospira sp. Nsp18]